MTPPSVTAYRTPSLIQVGWGALGSRGARVLAEAEVTRPLLVTDRIVGKLPVVLSALSSLEGVVEFAARFDDIPGEPTTREVEAGVRVLKSGDCDGILAVGGGSVIDTAKAIALLAANGGDLPTYRGTNLFARPGVPLVAAPTTAGTGSEVTRFTVITDPQTHVKMLITDDKMVARAAIVDPSLTVDAPPKVTASAGVDALTHAIEAFVSRQANPLANTLALSAIRRLIWALPAAFVDGQHHEARTATAIGALEAGLAFSNSSVALVHGTSRPLGAVFGVPHGIANAMLLRVVTEFSLDAATSRYATLAEGLGVDRRGLDNEAAARAGLRVVRDLCATLQIPSLGVYGLSREELEANAPKMAADALASGSPANNPRVPSAEEIVALYLGAY